MAPTITQAGAVSPNPTTPGDSYPARKARANMVVNVSRKDELLQLRICPIIACVVFAATSLGGCNGFTKPLVEPTVTEPRPSDPVTIWSSPDGAPVIVGGGASQQLLTLDDVFSASGWEEGEIEIPGSEAPIQRAMYRTISSGNEASIELRFRQPQGTLSIEVAQASTSKHIDVPVQWRLSADGRLVDIQTVFFGERRTMSLDLTGVAAVTLEAVAGQRETLGISGVTTAVIAELAVIPE